MDTIRRKIARTDCKGIDASRLCVKAVLSTPAEDSDGDIVDPLGIDTGEHKNNPVVLWAHQATLPPVAKAEDEAGRYTVEKAASGVHGVAHFSDRDEFSERLFRLYDDGILRAWSIGFRPKAADRRKAANGKNGLHVKASQLVEYSAVGVGANPDALTVRMQKGWGIRDENVANLLTAALAPFTIAGRAWSPGWTPETKAMDDSPNETAAADAAETQAEEVVDYAAKCAELDARLAEADKARAEALARVSQLDDALAAAREEITHKSGQVQDLNAEAARLRGDNTLLIQAAEKHKTAAAKFAAVYQKLTGKQLAAA